MKRLLALVKYMIIPFMVSGATLPDTKPNVEIGCGSGFILTFGSNLAYDLTCKDGKCAYDVYLKPGVYAFIDKSTRDTVSFYVSDSIATQIGIVKPNFNINFIEK